MFPKSRRPVFCNRTSFMRAKVIDGTCTSPNKHIYFKGVDITFDKFLA